MIAFVMIVLFNFTSICFSCWHGIVEERFWLFLLMFYLSKLFLHVMCWALYLQNILMKWRMDWSRSMIIGSMSLWWQFKLLLWSLSNEISFNMTHFFLYLVNVLINLLNVFRCFKNFELEFICGISIRVVLFILVFILILNLLLIWVNYVFIWTLVVIFLRIIWNFFMLNRGW